MNASQFTEPFCLERFRAGEPALFVDFGAIRHFSHMEGNRLRSKEGSLLDNRYEYGFYKMRPSPKLEDGWIPCGDDKPIPYQDIEVKVDDGSIYRLLATENIFIRRTQDSVPLARGKKIIYWRPYSLAQTVFTVTSISTPWIMLNDAADVDQQASEAAATIQKELEGIAQDIREIYRPLSQNEVMRIAGEAINGTLIGEVVTVDREVFAALVRSI